METHHSWPHYKPWPSFLCVRVMFRETIIFSLSILGPESEREIICYGKSIFSGKFKIILSQCPQWLSGLNRNNPTDQRWMGILKIIASSYYANGFWKEFIALYFHEELSSKRASLKMSFSFISWPFMKLWKRFKRNFRNVLGVHRLFTAHEHLKHLKKHQINKLQVKS